MYFCRHFSENMEITNISDKKTLLKIRTKFKKALNKYFLIENNDHILIGLSGGKDSLALLQLLGERMKIQVPHFKATAVHIFVENIGYSSDINYLREFSLQNGIPFITKTIRYENRLGNKKPECFLCSWHRRKALFNIAQELHCNKIALGHHLDDTVETVLMNLFYQGAFAGMPPKISMSKFDMTIIRPMCFILENEVLAMQRIMEYKPQIKNCPYEKDSSRSKIKELVKQLGTLNPEIRESIRKATENIKTDYLP